MTTAQKKRALDAGQAPSERRSTENQRGTKPPAAAVSPEARPAANFDARTVRSANASHKHGSKSFTWRDLCDATDGEPTALGSSKGLDEQQRSAVKSAELRAFCRPCVARIRNKKRVAKKNNVRKLLIHLQ